MTEGTRSTPRVALIASTLAICGSLIGSGIAQLVASRLLVLAPAPALRLPRVEMPAPPLVAGGLFAPDAPEPPSAPATSSTMPCDPAWRLVGAAVFVGAPERSIAALHTPSGGAVLEASERRDEWTLVAVEPDRVTVRGPDGRECEVAMHADAITDDNPPAAQDPSASLVEALSDRHYRVDRRAIEQASMEPRLRLVPRVDERGASVRVYGVRPGSLAAQAGIENGDVVTAIDGQPPTSERALDAYARALRGEAVRLGVERRGQPLELGYELSP